MTENTLANGRHYAGTITISKSIPLRKLLEIMSRWKECFPNYGWVALYTRDGGRHHNRIEFVVQLGEGCTEDGFEALSETIIDIMIGAFGKSIKGNPNHVPSWSMSSIVEAV